MKKKDVMGKEMGEGKKFSSIQRFLINLLPIILNRIDSANNLPPPPPPPAREPATLLFEREREKKSNRVRFSKSKGRGRKREREGERGTGGIKNKAGPKKIPLERKGKISLGPGYNDRIGAEIEPTISISFPRKSIRSCFQSGLFGLSFDRATAFHPPPLSLSLFCLLFRACRIKIHSTTTARRFANPLPLFHPPPRST